MYLVFKSKDPETVMKPVYGVEFNNSVPTFVTTDSDMVYIDVGDGSDPDVAAKVNQILANISNVYLNVTVYGIIECSLDKVVVTTDNPDRHIDPEDWNNVVLPAWYRAASYTDHARI